MKEQDSMQTKLLETIDSHLRKIGVSKTVDGFEYLKKAIAIVVENPDLLMEDSKVIYNTVAEHFNTTYSNVEKLMRYAVESVFDCASNANAIMDYFGNTISQKKGKATNLEFIAAIVEQIVEEHPRIKMVAKYLRTIGIPMHLKGYQHLKLGIAIALEHHKLIDSSKNEFFYKLAVVFQEKPQIIEKNITNVIKKTYQDRGDPKVLQQYFGNSMPGCFDFVKLLVKRINEEEYV